MVRRRTLFGGALAIILAPSAADAEKTWPIAFFSVAAGKSGRMSGGDDQINPPI
jgi:hypothetical protein